MSYILCYPARTPGSTAVTPCEAEGLHGTCNQGGNARGLIPHVGVFLGRITPMHDSGDSVSRRPVPFCLWGCDQSSATHGTRKVRGPGHGEDGTIAGQTSAGVG